MEPIRRRPKLMKNHILAGQISPT
ncbi:hypothetical protein TYRP_008039 [Tyrophagus putrescentiae]|nr:hypothetical protein TYRP_008039 [Tyrophagus putrescentiae]